MPYTLNNVTTQDSYTQATTMSCPDSVRVNLHVFNNAIFFRLATAPGTTPGAQASGEIFRAPGLYSMDRYTETVEVRSAVKGTPAQVTIDAWRAAELVSGNA
jgi:hypothetical protein